MNLEKFTDRSQGFLQEAEKYAVRLNHQFLVPAHLLHVMLEDKEGLASKLVESSGANPDIVRGRVRDELDKIPAVEGQSVQLQASNDFMKMLDTAEQMAQKAKDAYVSVERLLQAVGLQKNYGVD